MIRVGLIAPGKLRLKQNQMFSLKVLATRPDYYHQYFLHDKALYSLIALLIGNNYQHHLSLYDKKIFFIHGITVHNLFQYVLLCPDRYLGGGLHHGGALHLQVKQFPSLHLRDRTGRTLNYFNVISPNPLWQRILTLLMTDQIRGRPDYCFGSGFWCYGRTWIRYLFGLISFPV